jgi:hypothetical protein
VRLEPWLLPASFETRPADAPQDEGEIIKFAWSFIPQKKNRALAGPVEFAGVGAPTITFQRGTAACIVVADLGGFSNLLPRSV